MNRKEACDFVADIITKDRARTHGEAVTQLANVQQIKRVVGHHSNSHLNDTILEAIDSICIKLSRLANGQPIEDHFLDIMGYAAIAVESLHLNRPVDDEILSKDENANSNNVKSGSTSSETKRPWIRKSYSLDLRDLENG